MGQKQHHATITLERYYEAPVERVFAEFADPVARARWSAPSNDILIYDAADFREGGRDIFRCSPKTDPKTEQKIVPKFRGETFYHLIVPNQRVVSTETLRANRPDASGSSDSKEPDREHLAVSLTTLDFEPIGPGTKIKVTVQVVSFVGPGLVAGYEAGNAGALENLARHLRGEL
jgi:uncharacterized protein YndB with AHSA1/START domain